MFQIILIIIFFIKTNFSTIYYIGKIGTCFSDCTKGQESNDPWIDCWNFKINCPKPGDTIIFLEGKYMENDGLISRYFFGKGNETHPIKYTVDYELNDKKYPVVFEGSEFGVSDESSHMIIDGFEIIGIGTGSSTGIVGLGSQYITIQNCYIHSTYEEVIANPGFDCLKFWALDGNGIRCQGIKVLNNIIEYCAEDCIDVTGCIDLEYRNNDIGYCKSNQIKGGTENILIHKNYFHWIKFPLVGFGMSLNLGNPDIYLLPVEERYIARNVTVKENVFYDMHFGPSIYPNGWKDSNIHHNTVFNSSYSFVFGMNTMESYMCNDPIVIAYCSTYTCIDCSALYGGATCFQLEQNTINLQFKNNLFDEFYGRAILIDNNQDFSSSYNLWHNIYNVLLFSIDYNDQSMDTFPYEMNSYGSNSRITKSGYKICYDSPFHQEF